jgi:hypothetical protein
MKNAARFAVCLSAAAFLPLAPACSGKPKPLAPEPARVAYSPYSGLWEGRTQKGEIFTVRFTTGEWEAKLESGGIERPHYKGTYTFAGSRVDLLITHEADTGTMGWAPQKGNLGPSLVGRLTGGKLAIQALTDAELVKKLW